VAVTDSPGEGRVWVAEGAGPLAAEPTWTRYDAFTNSKCYGYDCFAGRQSELDTTDPGTATVFFHDKAKAIDTDLVGLQILLQLYDPIDDAWHIRWRGHIDDVARDLRDVPSAPDLANVSLNCTGIFDYLGGVKMKPGVFGDAFPAAITGTDVVFYEDERVDDRIFALLDDAGISSAMRVVFTGNVDVNETLYDPDDVILQALRDAADAEFPGVANVYEDRYGRVAFHGRFARFDPEGTAASASNWDFQRWEAATREDVTGSVAQIREFSYNAPRARIINSYIAWPRADENGVEIDRSLIAAQLVEDATSITAYGHRGGDAQDLIIKENFNNSNTGLDECLLFAQFYVENYAVPRKAIQNVVFKSHRTTDARGAATWALMCRADIADAIDITVDEADLAGESFFIDGIGVSCRPLLPALDYVEVTPNLTPASYYGTDVFNP
jgi:hypothetical protein